MALDVSLDEVIEKNIDKLKSRYPGGEFDAHYSENPYLLFHTLQLHCLYRYSWRPALFVNACRSHVLLKKKV